MHPVVFTIPWIERDIPGYGLMLMIGFLLAVWWAVSRARRSQANPDVILDLGFIALIAGVVGARAMYVVHYWDQFKHRGDALAIAWGIVDITRGGLEYYGGFILTVLVVPLYLRFVKKVSIRWYLDIVAPSAALGLAFGRIGCYLNGCCFGATCELPWAVHFPFGSPAAHDQWKANRPGSALPEQLLFTHGPGLTAPISRESIFANEKSLQAAIDQTATHERVVADLRKKLDAAEGDAKKTVERELKKAETKLRAAQGQFADLRGNAEKYGMPAAQIQAMARQHHSLAVHPTQLYSTITAGLIALLLHLAYWRRTRDGQVIFLLLAIEPLARMMLELIRADNPIDTLGKLTISQFLALVMTGIGIAGLIVLQRCAPRSPRAKIFVPEDEKEAPQAEAAASR